VPTDYNNFISSKDVQDNVNIKPLQERINKIIGENEVNDIEPTESLNYTNHSGYNLPLSMDLTK